MNLAGRTPNIRNLKYHRKCILKLVSAHRNNEFESKGEKAVCVRKESSIPNTFRKLLNFPFHSIHFSLTLSLLFSTRSFRIEKFQILLLRSSLGNLVVKPLLHDGQRLIEILNILEKKEIVNKSL